MDSSLEFSNSLSSVSSAPVRCRIFKIIVIGDSGVGKTCLTHRFCSGQFPERTDTTIGVDFRERVVYIEGEKIKLQLWDTAGQERFRKSMVQQYYRNVHAVLFVYDVTRPASFQALNTWVEECRCNSLGQNIPRFLVGNKSDLRDRLGLGPDQVSRERAQRFADALGMTLFETSAKNPGRDEIGGGGGRGGGGRGGGGGGLGGLGAQHQQERVEAVFLALAARVMRQKNPPVPTRDAGGVTASFKLPPKKRPDNDMWACTC